MYLFFLYYTEAAGANGINSHCYFQIKKINADARVWYFTKSSKNFLRVSIL